MRLDQVVQLRLGECRLVRLVMSMPAIPNDVNEKVFMKALAICDCQADGLNAGFSVIGVDVDNRDLESLCEVARVVR